MIKWLIHVSRTTTHGSDSGAATTEDEQHEADEGRVQPDRVGLVTVVLGRRVPRRRRVDDALVLRTLGALHVRALVGDRRGGRGVGRAVRPLRLVSGEVRADVDGRDDRGAVGAGGLVARELRADVHRRGVGALLRAGDLRPGHVGVVTAVRLLAGADRTLRDELVTVDGALVDLDPRLAEDVGRPGAVLVEDGLLGLRLDLPALVDQDPRLAADLSRPVALDPAVLGARRAVLPVEPVGVAVVARLEGPEGVLTGTAVLLGADPLATVVLGERRLVVLRPLGVVGRPDPPEVRTCRRALDELLVLVLLDALDGRHGLLVLELLVRNRNGPCPLPGALLRGVRVGAGGVLQRRRSSCTPRHQADDECDDRDDPRHGESTHGRIPFRFFPP